MDDTTPKLEKKPAALLGTHRPIIYLSEYPKALRMGVYRRFQLATLLTWVAAILLLGLPNEIAGDWNGWRESDTQSIAMNYAKHGVDILYPRINWDGDNPGFVETEFQLFTAIIAPILRHTGDVAWPGRMVSLIAICITLMLSFRLLWREFGPVPTWIAMLFLMSQRGMLYLATYIQPDALCLMFYIGGLVAFLTYVRINDNSALWLSALLTAIAGLIKPTALNAGIIQFSMLLFIEPGRLKTWRPWVAWALILAIVGVYLLHARELYLNFGNTFGIASGGDSKFPGISDLIKPGLYWELFKQSLHWGCGPFALLLALRLVWKRHWDGLTIALIIGNIAALIIPLRYTSSDFATHYYMFSMMLGAWLIADAMHSILYKNFQRRIRFVIPILLLFPILLTYNLHMRDKLEPQTPDVMVAKELKNKIPADSLIVVRSPTVRWDVRWQTINNFEDPRVLYVLSSRGWIVARDDEGAAPISQHASKADYYVEPAPAIEDPALTTWLDKHAQLIHDSDHGRAWKINRANHPKAL